MSNIVLKPHISLGVSSSERLEILPVSLLESEAERVAEFLSLSRTLRVPLGWHYLLDLAWAAEALHSLIKPGTVFLDAGAGTGLMQWWLADHGVEVISVDRMPRRFARQLHAWAPIVDFRSGNTSARRDALRNLVTILGQRPVRHLVAAIRDLFWGYPAPADRARVRTLEANLLDLSEVPTGSVDAVVSISSLEHNSPEALGRIVTELMRILRPGGRIVATLGAAKEQDWYHEPSSGWCYTESSLRRAFDLGEDAFSNYKDYDALFEALRDCCYLRDNLSDFYFHSGNNGMPWGKWEPLYQSVGVIKVKA
jgi:SAM-dependent methyltransferase